MSNHHNLCASSENDEFRFKQCVETSSPNSNTHTKNCNNINNTNNNNCENVCKENTASCQNTDTGNSNTCNQLNTNNNSSSSENKLVQNNIANTELDLLSKLINSLPNNPERIPQIFGEMYKLLQTHIEEGNVNLVKLVVYTLIRLLNNTVYVTILAPYALQIITLLFAYFNRSNKNVDHEGKSETKNKNLSKRHNVKIWIYGIAAAELFTVLLTRLLQEQEEKKERQIRKEQQLEEQQVEEKDEEGKRELAINTLPSSSFYSSCRLVCGCLNQILPVLNAMCEVRLNGESQADKLFARNASLGALNKLSEYALAANTLLEPLFNNPPSLALPSIAQPENNLYLPSSDNNNKKNNTNDISRNDSEHKAQPETSQNVQSEMTHGPPTPDVASNTTTNTNSSNKEDKETNTVNTIKALVHVLPSKIKSYRKLFTKFDGDTTNTTATADNDVNGEDQDRHEGAEKNNQKEIINSKNNSSNNAEKDTKLKSGNADETKSSNAKSSTINICSNIDTTIDDAVNNVLGNLLISSHLERAQQGFICYLHITKFD